jgi:glycerol-3-phosphate dehydrogenase
LLLNAKESRRIAPEVASIMAIVLGKDEQWKKDQVETFNKLAEQYILK